MIEQFQAAAGLALVLFMPGYALSLVIFEKLKLLERFLLSFGLSFLVVSALALILGSPPVRRFTGGWTMLSVVGSLAGISLALLIAAWAMSMRKKGRTKKQG